MDNYLVLHVRENSCRSLKTRGSDPQIPIVSSCVKQAVDRLLAACSGSDYLFPRYARDGHLNNTGASATLCKFLKASYGGKTTHCLQHALRDRLRDAEVPPEPIDQICGSLSVGGAGSKYGRGYTTSNLARYLSSISVGLSPAPEV